MNLPEDTLHPNPLEQILTLAEAARLSGLSAHTLTQQAERGKLQARKIGHTWITTKDWLDKYLAAYSSRRSRQDDATRAENRPGRG